MSNNSNYYNRLPYAERKEKSHNKNKSQKALAGLALGLALITGASLLATKTETGKKAFDGLKSMFDHSENVSQDYFDDVAGSPSIKFDIDKYEPSIDDKNTLVYDNGIEAKTIEYRKLADDEVIVIEEGASVRSAPVIGNGENGSSTIASANQEIRLDDINSYLMYSTDEDYADKFFGFKVEDLPESIVQEIDYKKADIYWVKAGEAMIEKKDSVGILNTETASETS